MSPRPAILTQAEVARAIRAARREGAAEIEVRPDGGIIVRLQPSTEIVTGPIEPTKDIVL